MRYPYFETVEPLRWDEATTYTDGDVQLEHTTTYEWNHGLAETVQALIDAGLQVTSLQEHRDVEWEALPGMVQDAEQRGALPTATQIPLMYSLTAIRPAD